MDASERGRRNKTKNKRLRRSKGSDHSRSLETYRRPIGSKITEIQHDKCSNFYQNGIFFGGLKKGVFVAIWLIRSAHTPYLRFSFACRYRHTIYTLHVPGN